MREGGRAGGREGGRDELVSGWDVRLKSALPASEKKGGKRREGKNEGQKLLLT